MMTNEDDQEKDVPLRAVQALNAAHQRAVAAGHPIVLVQDGKLIRRVGGTITVLKPMLGRKKVQIRVKRREA